MESANDITLRLVDGSMLAVPATLRSITTYTLLEQERWFEKEFDFLTRWLRPGMTAIDIGANLGVYSVPMARCVGTNGKVYAFEPASEPRALLHKSCEANRAENLVITGAALSNRPRQGRLLFGTSSELNKLEERPDGAEPGETVPITSLDHEERTRNWGTPDFVKLDAEGEEERIIDGGREFFTKHSPLVMFEIRQGASINHGLVAAFRGLGYDIYRAIPYPLLVPFLPGEELDGYELNLLAAKKDRAIALKSDAALIENVPAYLPDMSAAESAFDVIRAQAYATAFLPLFSMPIHPGYRAALIAFAAWRNTKLELDVRYAAVRYACDTLLRLCEEAPNAARLSTLARAALEAGRRSVAVAALQAFLSQMHRTLRVDEPFWPASARFDVLTPRGEWLDWFIASMFECYERTKNLSSVYGPSGVDLDWLCRSPYGSSEMERRRVLHAWRNGRPVIAPPRLGIPGADNMNAELWRSGRIQTSLGL
jgi:FkbM family methyltransferase